MKASSAPRPRGRQRGVFAIMYAIILLPLLGMIGLAIDLSMLYARWHEMQAVADGAALAAARTLNGTKTGIDNAVTNAGATAVLSEYRFVSRLPVTWSDGAVSFGTTRDGPWFSASEINDTQAATMYFARVDTGQLAAAMSEIYLSFMRVLPGVNAVQRSNATAVAGRRDSAITPLAICALAPEPIGHRRPNGATAAYEEVLEFGFRRGVSYNLLNLNPKGVAPVSYVFNPVAYQGSIATDLADAVRPFVCTGTAPAPPMVAGTLLAVRLPFPTSLIGELNSRLSPYPASPVVCTPFSAPPDSNVYDFRGWFNSPAPTQAQAANYAGSAAQQVVPAAVPANPALPGKLVTVADTLIPPADTGAASYGPLWAFARPLKFDLAANAATTTQFDKADWGTLYPPSLLPPTPTVPPAPPAAPLVAPSTTYGGSKPPYFGAITVPVEAAASGFRAVPKNSANTASLTGLARRRTLTVPLLECPVTTTSSAKVLGIGQFMMTTKATAATAPPAIHAEFIGATTYGALADSAVLYQ